MKLNKISPLFFLSILIFIFSISSTFAYFTSGDHVINHFSTGSIKVEIEEDFTPGSEWGVETIIKKVTVKNTGQNPALVRVQIIPYWLDKDGQFVVGDMNYFTINYNENNLIKDDGINNPQKWILGDDGFYYYTSIVPVNGTTSVLLESVTLNQNLPLSYEGMKLMVDVEVEAIQVTQEAYQEAWRNIPDKIQAMLENLVKSHTSAIFENIKE